MGSQLLFELAYDLLPVRLLSLGLLRVPADQIAPTPLTLTDDDLLDLEVVRQVLVATAAAENLLVHLVDACDAGGQDVASSRAGKLGPVGLGVHPRVPDEEHPVELPTPQVRANPFHRAHVRSVAGEDPAPDGEPFLGDRQRHDDLGRPPAFLAVAELAPAVAFVRVVDGELRGGGVVEDQVDFEIHQVGDREEDALLQLGLVGLEEVQGLVEVAALQGLGTIEEDSFQPALVDTQLGGGFIEAIGHHGEQRTFESRGGLLPPQRLADDGSDAESLPELVDHMDHPERAGTVQGDAALEQGVGRGRLRVLLRGQRVVDLNPTGPSDGAAEADKGVPVQRVGAPEVVDDLHARALGDGVTMVVGELVVRDDGAVLVGALGGPQVHAHIVNVYWRLVKRTAVWRVSTQLRLPQADARLQDSPGSALKARSRVWRVMGNTL